MKHFFILILFLGILFPGSMQGQVLCSPDSVEKISQFEDLYRYGNIYIGGQPSRSMITWFESEGVTQIVNLRTTKENRHHSRKEFKEKDFVESMGLIYIPVPVGESKSKNKYDKLSKVAEALNSGEKVLMHCKTGARARYFLAAYLVREKNCTEESAKQIAKEMGYFFPLDLFFKNEVTMENDADEKD